MVTIVLPTGVISPWTFCALTPTPIYGDVDHINTGRDIKALLITGQQGAGVAIVATFGVKPTSVRLHLSQPDWPTPIHLLWTLTQCQPSPGIDK